MHQVSYFESVRTRIPLTCQLVIDKQFGLGFSPNLESNAFCPLFMTTSQQHDPGHDMRPDLALFCSEIDAYRELGIFLRPTEIRA